VIEALSLVAAAFRLKIQEEGFRYVQGTSDSDPVMTRSSDAHWIRSPLTTRHSQTILVLVGALWGLSYVMPWGQRIAFAEVFPPSLEKHAHLPIWVWGAGLLTGSLLALAGERLLLMSLLRNDTYRSPGWPISISAHMLLSAIYITLSVSALVTGFTEAAAVHFTAPAVLSALSRPFLWGYLGYQHVTYALLPTPYPTVNKKKKGRIRLFVRDPVQVHDGEGHS
jgi:hypothetical protein